MTETNETYEAYHATPKAPSRTLAWNVYGKGVENVGRNGRPEEVDVPAQPPLATTRQKYVVPGSSSATS